MLLGLLLSIGTLMGCSVFQGGQAGSPSAPPEDQADVAAREPRAETPADTALASRPESPDSTVVEATPDEVSPSEAPRLESYHMALMLPFLANRFDTFDLEFRPISRWSMQYFMGLQLAAQELAEQDMDIRLSVYDSEGEPDKVAQLMEEPGLEEAHLIFGPYRRVNLQEMAEFAKAHEVNLVSPYSAASNITADNPHFIQARPSMRTHCERLVEHALEHYRPEQIVLVGRNRDIDRAAINHFQEGYYKHIGTRAAPGLMEYYIESETADYEEIDVFPFIDTLLADTTVFLVSAWAGDDETFVYSLMREIEVARQFGEMGPEENTVVMYGTPVWLEYERTPLDYYRKLNLHLSSSTFIDREDPQVQAFQRAFFNEFGLLPAEEAFLGYDLMYYFGEMLYRYGPAFQLSLEKEPRRGLHTFFNFQRVVPRGSRAEDNPPIQHFENQFVHILQFNDYAFEPVRNAEE